MAKLRNAFLKGVETIFKTFEEAVNTGTYTVVADNGFDTSSSTEDTIRCIFDKFKEKDVELLTFYKLIQPTDIKGLTPFVDLVNNSEITTQGSCKFDNVNYEIVAFDLDPMKVLFTLLLRKN
ncbi:MAG: hypothetical protein GY861_14325 [bacterium]|nr:hypothetical protein [bacterium]